ncbi:hypothetical protein [Streptomyces sp. NPDC094032]|uniref:hypothetical protein n=1 Tax=Streptomyces sp. NPDC094032 TaxID=3155308 RepID=UPI003323FD78
MPQHDEHDPHDVTDGRFEEELGAVLRATGDGFAAHDRRELATGGLARGRRRLLRRRVATAGGALALAAIGVGGVYGGSLLGTGAEGPAGVSVAAGPKPGGSGQAEQAAGKPGGEPDIPVADLAAVLKANTPAGQWEIQNPEGRGQAVSAVYEDGKGQAAVTVGLFRAGGDGEAGTGQVTCPDKVGSRFDDCTEEKLADGSRLMVLQGYEYADRREETKNWRAVLLTKDGFLVDASEYNAAAEKGAPVSRENPPFSPAQMKALVTAKGWKPLLKRLPGPRKPFPGTPGRPADGPSRAEIQATLISLLPRDARVVDKGKGGFSYVVVDDGKGKSLVEIDVQPAMTGIRNDVFGGSDVTTEPDGTRVKLEKKPGEKGGEGVLWWSADTLALDDFRVIVSSYNAATHYDGATRAKPALTTEQLKAIALSPKWRALAGK